jgi:hypothetical protein
VQSEGSPKGSREGGREGAAGARAGRLESLDENRENQVSIFSILHITGSCKQGLVMMAFAVVAVVAIVKGFTVSGVHGGASMAKYRLGRAAPSLCRACLSQRAIVGHVRGNVDKGCRMLATCVRCNTVLVSIGSGEIHELNMATFSKVSTIRAEMFTDDPRAGTITASTDAMRLSLQVTPQPSSLSPQPTAYLQRQPHGICVARLRIERSRGCYTVVERVQHSWRCDTGVQTATCSHSMQRNLPSASLERDTTQDTKIQTLCPRPLLPLKHISATPTQQMPDAVTVLAVKRGSNSALCWRGLKASYVGEALRLYVGEALRPLAPTLHPSPDTTPHTRHRSPLNPAPWTRNPTRRYLTPLPPYPPPNPGHRVRAEEARRRSTVKRELFKDAFRSYASSALTEITAIDTISLNEIRTFIKDMRFSTRVIIKLAQIYHTTLNSASMFEDGRRVDGGAEESQGEFDDEDQELGPAKFVEFVIHLSQEQIPGKDNIARKVQMMLNTMQGHA